MTKHEAQSRHGGTDGLFTKPSRFGLQHLINLFILKNKGVE